MATPAVDPVNFHDTTAWANLIITAYDREVEFKRRSMPLFNQFFNKKVVSPTNESSTFVFTLHQDYAIDLTPLAETVTPAALTAPTPQRVTITAAEYGDYAVDTIKMEKVAFTKPKAELVTLLARQQADKIDGLAKAVCDTTTNIRRTAGRTTDGTVAAADVLSAAELRKIVTQMQRNLCVPLSGNEFTMVAHPDVLFDIRNESGANTWSAPHTYQDTSNIYSGEIGSYAGMRFIQSVRATPLTGVGASGINVQQSYVFSDQAVAEVTLQAPTTVIGPQVDPLRRFNTVGWKMFWGAGLYRPEALLKVKSSSSFA